MTPYPNVSRQELVDELLAPHSAHDPAGQSLLVHRLDVARELLLRDLARQLQNRPLLESQDSMRVWLLLYFLGQERELFVALFLDVRHRLIHAEDMFQGTIDGAEVHPREVARLALRHNAASVCVAHNHPSGSAEPSAADRALTARLKQALSLVETRLLDHFVVAGDEVVSLAERGWV